MQLAAEILKDNQAVNTIETGIKIETATTREVTNTNTAKDIAEKEVAKTHLQIKIKTEIGVMTRNAIVNIAPKTTRRSITSIGDTTQTRMNVVHGRDQDHPLPRVQKTNSINTLNKRPKMQLTQMPKQLELRP